MSGCRHANVENNDFKYKGCFSGVDIDFHRLTQFKYSVELFQTDTNLTDF